ncbi:MAG: serine hydrolase domain-containing protein [Gemmatimonadaceae bacterium]
MTVRNFRNVLLFAPLLAVSAFRENGAHALADRSSDLPGLAQLVDSVVRSGMAAEKIPGAAVLVLQDGKVVLERGYGVADVASRRAVNPRTTLWPFASITKVFTATAVVQLAARGRVDLMSDVNRYLKSVRVPTAAWPPITLANLLTHTDALDELPGRQAPSRSKVVPLDRFLRDRLVRFGPPGIMTRYGTYGIALAGVLIQDVSGLSYETYLDRNLFTPLGMRHTSITPPITGGDSIATPYEIDDGKLKAIPPEWYATTPTSSLVSTVDDMARFMAFHLDTPLQKNAEAVLPRKWIREMARQQATVHPAMPGWGYGWQQNDANGQRIIEHGGDIGGFASLLTLLPDQHFGILVVHHLEGSALRFKVKQAILDRYFPDKRVPLKGIARPKSELLAYAGTYLANNYCRTCPDGETNAQRFEVVANDNGSLGLTGDEWREVGPLLFSSSDGKRRIGFMRDSSGLVTAVTAGSWRVIERARAASR